MIPGAKTTFHPIDVRDLYPSVAITKQISKTDIIDNISEMCVPIIQTHEFEHGNLDIIGETGGH